MHLKYAHEVSSLKSQTFLMRSTPTDSGSPPGLFAVAHPNFVPHARHMQLKCIRLSGGGGIENSSFVCTLRGNVVALRLIVLSTQAH